jgi:hypothetical protein
MAAMIHKMMMQNIEEDNNSTTEKEVWPCNTTEKMMVILFAILSMTKVSDDEDEFSPSPW